MSTDSLRSLHFGPLPKGEGRPGPTAASAPLNPLLAMGELLRNQRVVEDKLRLLHLDAATYHGNLQVILSALKRSQAHVAAMIEDCEGK